MRDWEDMKAFKGSLGLGLNFALSESGDESASMLDSWEWDHECNQEDIDYAKYGDQKLLPNYCTCA